MFPNLNTIYWSPESRITLRRNKWLEGEAERKGIKHIPLTVEEIRQKYIKDNGKEAWGKRLLNEARNRQREIWRYEDDN